MGKEIYRVALESDTMMIGGRPIFSVELSKVVYASQITLSRSPRANAWTCSSMDIRSTRTELIAADYEAVIAKPSIPSGKANLTLICRNGNTVSPNPSH